MGPGNKLKGDKMKYCEYCYYWSELIAHSIGGGPVEALCGTRDSNFFNKMTRGNMSCDAFTEKIDGMSYDDPSIVYGD